MTSNSRLSSPPRISRDPCMSTVDSHIRASTSRSPILKKKFLFGQIYIEIIHLHSSPGQNGLFQQDRTSFCKQEDRIHRKRVPFSAHAANTFRPWLICILLRTPRCVRHLLVYLSSSEISLCSCQIAWGIVVTEWRRCSHILQLGIYLFLWQSKYWRSMIGLWDRLFGPHEASTLVEAGCLSRLSAQIQWDVPLSFSEI